jgi:hypothetical protein
MNISIYTTCYTFQASSLHITDPQYIYLHERKNQNSYYSNSQLFSQLYNQWVSTVAYVGRKKLKVRLNISVFFTDLAQWGVGTRAANGGVSEDPASDFFLRAFWVNDERSVKGEGGRRACINPLPPGYNHRRTHPSCALRHTTFFY